MCGIVGYVGNEQCANILVEGLRKLEYRGYDSAGVAVLDAGLAVVRAKGKLKNLEEKLRLETPRGTCGIGHTRWATHGRPSDENAHPHQYGGVAVVHNGIIENHLRAARPSSPRPARSLQSGDRHGDLRAPRSRDEEKIAGWRIARSHDRRAQVARQRVRGSVRAGGRDRSDKEPDTLVAAKNSVAARHRHRGRTRTTSPRMCTAILAADPQA